MNTQESAKLTEKILTEKIWNLFSTFNNLQLDSLLESAGIKPCRDRSFKIQQILNVWFHGSIPNLAVIPELAEKVPSFYKINDLISLLTKGSRTEAALKREGIENPVLIAQNYPDMFEISESISPECSGKIISIRGEE